MWIYVSLKLFVCLVEIIIGTYVLFKAKRVYRVWMFFFSCLFLGLWLAAKAFYSIEVHFREPVLDNIVLFLGAYMSAFTYLFILSFPKCYLSPLVHKWCVFIILFVYSILAVSTSFSGIIYEVMPNGIYTPVSAGIPFVISMYSHVQIVSACLCIFYWINSYYKEICIDNKNLIMFTSIAFLLGRMGPGIFFNLFLVSMGIYMFIDVIFFTSLIWQLTFFYVICYRKAFELRTAIHYSVFWLLISFLFVVPSILSIRYCMYLASFLEDAFLSAVCLYVPTIIYVSIYFKWIQPLVDRWFFKYKYELQEQFELLCSKLNMTLSEDHFFNIISLFLQKHLYVQDVAYYIFNSNSNNYSYFKSTHGKGPQYIESHDVIHLDFETHSLSRDLSDFVYCYLIKNNNTVLGILFLTETYHLKELTLQQQQFIQNLCNVSASYLNNVRLYSQLEQQHLFLKETQNSLVESERVKTSLFEQKNYIQKLSCGIIHEVKNTNLSIEGLIKQLLQQPVTDSSFVLNAIGKQSHKLVHFSRNFLYQELIETDQIVLDLSLVDLNQVISKSLDLNLYFTASDLLTITVQPSMPSFIFDYNKLHLIINNIIHNTEKYSKNQDRLCISFKENETHVVLTFKHFSSNETMNLDHNVHLNSTGLGFNISKKLLSYLKSDLFYEKKPDCFMTELVLHKGFI